MSGSNPHHRATDGCPTRLLSVMTFIGPNVIDCLLNGRVPALRRSCRFDSCVVDTVSCPITFDASQDWVIVHKRVVAGSTPASGSRCRGSSMVEHVNAQFVSYPSVLSAGRRSWVIGHCRLAVQIRFRVSTRVAQFVERQCYPDRSLSASFSCRAQALLMGRRHRVISYWFESNPGHRPR